MSKITDELFEIAEQLNSIRAKFDLAEVKLPLQKLEDATQKVGKSWSGSWLGYHSRVYYRDFRAPPPGAHFSQEWGSMHYSIDGTTGDWAEYDYDKVRNAIFEIADNPDLEPIRKLVATAQQH